MNYKGTIIDLKIKNKRKHATLTNIEYKLINNGFIHIVYTKKEPQFQWSKHYVFKIKIIYSQLVDLNYLFAGDYS